MMKPYTLRSLWDMYTVDASSLLSSCSVLSKLIASVESGSVPVDEYIQDSHKNGSIGKLNYLIEVLEPLDVPVTKITIEEALYCFENEDLTFRQCGEMFNGISKNLERELSITNVMTIPREKSKFYSPKSPLFGPEVDARYPCIAYDIDQAGKCYACELYTGSVFHSIRCLESCIKAISQYLGIPDPVGKDKNWGCILKTIREEINKKWPTPKDRECYEAKSLQGIQAALSAIQNPYRNATMHLESKYQESEAYHMFEMVKGLLKKTASIMDENGVLN